MPLVMLLVLGGAYTPSKTAAKASVSFERGEPS